MDVQRQPPCASPVPTSFMELAGEVRRDVFGGTSAADPISPQARTLAAASLLLWMGAIVAGRLMAYTTTF